MLTECSKIKQAYEVLCAKWTWKTWRKNILTLHRYRGFRVGVFKSWITQYTSLLPLVL